MTTIPPAAAPTTRTLKERLQFRFNKTLTEEDKKKTRVVLGTTIICFLLNIFLGYPNFYEMVFQVPHFVVAGLSPTDATYWWVKIYYTWGMACVFYFVVPGFVARKLKLTRQDLGLQLGDNKFGLSLLAVGAVSVPITALAGLVDPVMLATYPLIRPVADWASFGLPSFNLGLFLIAEFSYIVVFYIPYEFFWRGFAQLPLRKYGKVNTFWIVLWTTVLTTIVHLPVPTTELAAAALVGLIYGWLAIRTDSILYGLVHHVATGISSDAVCTAKINNWI